MIVDRRTPRRFGREDNVSSMRSLALLFFATGILTLAITAGMHAMPQGKVPPALDTSLDPTFDVAAIRRNQRRGPISEVRVLPGGRFIATSRTIPELIDYAYGLGDFQRVIAGGESRIVGGPSWIRSERFDVNASAGRDAPSSELSRMVRALLADRFKLVVHQETRDRPTYALRRTQLNELPDAQLRRLDVDCRAVAEQRGTLLDGKPPQIKASNGAPLCGMSFNDGVLKSGGLPMERLALSLSRWVGRDVVDQTGLAGIYEFTLRFSSIGERRQDDQERPMITVALREQLGLRLESQRNQIEVTVIDRVDRPTAD